MMLKTFWLYSHNLTNSGAPLVLFDIALSLRQNLGNSYKVKLISWGGNHDRRNPHLLHKLQDSGIECLVFDANQNPPRPHKHDRLLLNSLALPDSIIRNVMGWLYSRIINRVDYYAHESDPSNWITDKRIQDAFKLYLSNGSLRMSVPSKYTLSTYQKWVDYFGSHLKVQLPPISPLYMRTNVISENDFYELSLQTIGMVGSGNKGQLWLIRLVEAALTQIPQFCDGYRPIKLNFIGIEDGPYAQSAKYVIKRAEQLLGTNFTWHLSTSREQSLTYYINSGYSVNCSLKEAYSCSSAESLCYGLPLLRFRNGGWHEQLIPGITGFDLGNPSTKIFQFQVDLLNKLRSKTEFPFSEYCKQSLASRAHAMNNLMSIDYTQWLLSE